MSAEQPINLTQLLDTFQLLDKNKDGRISENELRSACQKLQMPVDNRKIKDLFQTRSSISFDEFCRIMQDFGQHPPDAYFNETFRAFDRNSDGYITAKEIKKTMKNLGEPLTDKQAKDMIKTADANGDGKLSQDEFRILFTYLTQQATTPPISPTPNSIPNSANQNQSNSPFKPEN